MDTYMQIASNLPQGLCTILQSLPAAVINSVEEIRLRCGQPVILTGKGAEHILDYRVTARELDKILHNLIQYSYYAYEDDLAKGFITIEGGHRVGICGRAVVKQGQPVLLKDISSMNIRFAREIKGCSRQILQSIMKEGRPLNTLIVSPPGCGKTTLLRDLARNFSERGFRVAVCDERSELTGMCRCTPAFDLGPRCDVLDGCEKAWGIPMLIRSMAPEIIITDEIGRPEDVPAAVQCLVSGVVLITSIHGSCREDLQGSAVRTLINDGFFQRLIYLSGQKGPGTIKQISEVIPC